MWANLNKIIKTMASPAPKVILYIPANIIKTIINKFPKRVSNKVTNKPGIVNMTSHKTINKLIKPTIKFTFFLSKKFILYIIRVKKCGQLKYCIKI
jgi:hypothetical protein